MVTRPPSGKIAAAIPRPILKMRVRIADHAIDSDFWERWLRTSSPQIRPVQEPIQKLWEDAACHIDRGLPKVSIIDITDSIRWR